jgi:putative acetyltransferase
VREPVAGIRRSSPEDAPALLEIWRRAVDATHDFLAPKDRQAIDALLAEHYFPTCDLLVAVDKAGAPIAFLGGSGRTIDALWVDPSVHGQGVGTCLLEEFAAGGAGTLEVDVNEQNHGVRQFYEKRGFRVVGRSALDGEGRPYPLLRLAR